ncbi:hypothetical protein DPMN_168287 [Dreissena polymorpha]|nr:hypothetical protein DPMN_168287 [Dreissena polymorpha]
MPKPLHYVTFFSPVVMMFFVGSLLMILTTLTFVVGGNMEKLCQPLLDLSMFKDVRCKISF